MHILIEITEAHPIENISASNEYFALIVYHLAYESFSNA